MRNDEIPKIILGTGSYNNVLSGNTVSITGDGGNAWGYFGPAYKKLAPRLVTYVPYKEKYDELVELKKDILKLDEYYKLKSKNEYEYIKSYYETRLKNLDLLELLNILNEKFDDNIILLCHENVSEFCHRRVLADYIELKTGIYIPEISVDSYGNIKKLCPIRYKKILKKVINECI